MSNRFRQLAPPYPEYEPTPLFGGSLPTIQEMGPPDVHPSALNPSYDLYRGAWGRNFAGLGGTSMQLSSDPSISTYANELDLLAAADDVQGNGVFDPPGTPGNIHPDEGILADHESLPGYIVRDRFYQPSQVIDGTTGEPVMFVPGGAVPIDQAQADTIRERQLLWELPPGVSPVPTTYPEVESDVIPKEWAWPVAGLGDDVAGDPGSFSTGELLAVAAIGGAAVGIFFATLRNRKG